MKEKIIKYIQENPYSNFGHIASFFDGRKKDLFILLNNMVNDGELIREDDVFLTPGNLGLLRAEIISVKPHYAFAKLFDSDEEVIIEEKYLHNAFLHDIVYLRFNVLFQVIKIVKREKEVVVGEVMIIDNKYYLDVRGITTANVKFVIENSSLLEGEIIKAHIDSENKDIVYTTLIEKLGHKNAPFMDITRVLEEHDCPLEFPLEIDEELATIPLNVDEKDLKDRIDLRQELIFTIDGSDAKDLDDAVSIKTCDYGYQVGVHIADVSYYVKEHSAIDQEALNRGTSIYVSDRVVPMLPFILSNGICSLNPHVDRLTISCFIDLDKNGKVISSKIMPSVINSKYRLDYDYVNNVISMNAPVNELEKQLLLLDKVAKLLQKNKSIQGELDLEIPELKIIVNEQGEAIDLKKKIQNDGEKLIENLMILANEQVAETFEKLNLPFIYRIHELPSSKKMEVLANFVSNWGLNKNFDYTHVKPKDLQNLLNNAKKDECYSILAQITLRSLAKAKYSIINKGHFGLASKCYTHFTSPIRRYPDLMVHRLIHKFLLEKKSINFKDETEYLALVAELSSIKERRAITVERESNDFKCAEYMHKFEGLEFWGFISGMNNSGLYVELENGVSGKVNFESMSDYYFTDTNSFHAYGRRKGKRYSLGDKINVIVESTNKDKGEIILSIKDEKRRSNLYNRRRVKRRR